MTRQRTLQVALVVALGLVASQSVRPAIAAPSVRVEDCFACTDGRMDAPCMDEDANEACDEFCPGWDFPHWEDCVEQAVEECDGYRYQVKCNM
jgi:hypothetical protein